MIKQKDQLTTVTASNVRGGNGDIFRTVVFAEEELLDKATMVALITVPPGSSAGEHAHGPDAELYYIISGTLRLTDDGITKDLVAGDAVFTGGGASHSVENVSDKDASMLAVVIK
ncbi:MAG: cupin domain-containing protein [Oscillospiraceae bacterium]|nr:cupin domain-containing protein [Oscillospiraceae bacterium]